MVTRLVTALVSIASSPKPWQLLGYFWQLAAGAPQGVTVPCNPCQCNHPASGATCEVTRFVDTAMDSTDLDTVVANLVSH